MWTEIKRLETCKRRIILKIMRENYNFLISVMPLGTRQIAFSISEFVTVDDTMRLKFSKYF